MNALFRVLDGNAPKVSRITDAETIVLLREENQKLTSEAETLRDEVKNTQSKLKEKKKELDRSRRVTEDLVQETAATGKRSRDEVRSLKEEVSELKDKRKALKSEIERITAERALIEANVDLKSKSYKSLEKKHRLLRYLCIGLAVILLIVVLFNWHAVLMFVLGAAKYIAKLAVVLLSGWAGS